MKNVTQPPPQDRDGKWEKKEMKVKIKSQKERNIDRDIGRQKGRMWKRISMRETDRQWEIERDREKKIAEIEKKKEIGLNEWQEDRRNRDRGRERAKGKVESKM